MRQETCALAGFLLYGVEIGTLGILFFLRVNPGLHCLDSGLSVQTRDGISSVEHPYCFVPVFSNDPGGMDSPFAGFPGSAAAYLDLDHPGCFFANGC